MPKVMIVMRAAGSFSPDPMGRSRVQSRRRTGRFRGIYLKKNRPEGAMVGAD